MSKRSIGKDKEKTIAKEHITGLFIEAEKVFGKNPALSDKYVKQARQIQMKFRLRMPKEYKRRFCKNCGKYLVPSVNSRVRINGAKIVYHCFSCKEIMRIPIKQ